MRILAFAALLSLQEGTVDDLVRELEAPDVRRAYRAVERLAARGESALADLESRAKAAQGRVKDLLDLAAGEARALRDLKDAYPKPARLSMKSNAKEVSELLSELEAKAGLKVDFQKFGGRAGQPLDGEFVAEDVTPLEALDAICKAGGARLYFQNGTLVVYPMGQTGGTRHAFGHYLFRIETAHRNRTLDFRRPPQKNLLLYLNLLWDPRVRPLEVRRDPEITEARDDRGRDLILPPEPDPPAEAPAEDEPFTNEPVYATYLSPVRLRLPESDATALGVLRGRAAVVYARSKSTVAVEKPEPGVKKQVDDFDVTLKSSAPDESYQFRAELEVASRKIPFEELRRKPVRLEITAKGGERMWVYTLQKSVKEPFTLRATFNWSGRGFRSSRDRTSSPAIEKIEITFVNETLEHVLPFEFRDVKLK